jgi:hypothetical protein
MDTRRKGNANSSQSTSPKGGSTSRPEVGRPASAGTGKSIFGPGGKKGA